MKHLSDRIVVFLAAVILLVGSQFLTWTRISPSLARASSNNNYASIASLRQELNVDREEVTQSVLTDESSTVKVNRVDETATRRNVEESDTSVQSPTLRPSKTLPGSFSADDAPSSEPFASPSTLSTPNEAEMQNSVVVYPSQMPTVPRDSSLSESKNNISPPDHETSKSGDVMGDKVRTFSFPRANLVRSTNRHQGEALHVPPLPALENDEKVPKNCAKWGVVTTISDPTEAIVRMSKLPEWCLVVVADAETPSDFMEQLATMGGDVESTVFFSVERQKKWELLDGPIGTFAQAVPWNNNNHHGRKNMGYLFAILHGAEFVFDFDEHNQLKLDKRTKEPLDILPSNTTLDEVTTVMVGPKAFNPYPIMMTDPSSSTTVSDGTHTSWARGFPLEYTNNNATVGEVAFQQESMPLVSKSSLIGVIQFVADVRPDFDPSSQEPTIISQQGVRFGNSNDNDKNKAHILVPKHSYSPYNSQATIHTQPALWATLLPLTVSPEMSDIWRSYVAQCIFADSNLRLVFAPPNKVDRIITHPKEESSKEEVREQYYQMRSGQLIEFLAHWDSTKYLSLPERVEQLWIDLYERSYIGIEDVQLLQKWLEALVAIGYQFPKLQPRFRNVAIMGQFNYADFPNIMAQTLFWTQKMRERFQTALVAGPFNTSQMELLESHYGIEAIATDQKMLEKSDDEREVDGFYSPLSNLMRALLQYRNNNNSSSSSSTIQAVLYIHDDALLNTTELSDGQYPFPTDKIIANRKRVGDVGYQNLRFIQDRNLANRMAHRVFPNNGTLSNVDKTLFVTKPKDLMKNIDGFHDKWEHWNTDYCAKGQVNMTMDPDFAKLNYLEKEDGTAWFPMHTQSDFLLVPTKYADEFAQAARLHLKHRIWIECAFGKMVDILQQKMGAKVRLVRLCTHFRALRGQFGRIKGCLKQEKRNAIAIYHPIKMREDLQGYSEKMDAMNYPIEEKKKKQKKK